MKIRREVIAPDLHRTVAGRSDWLKWDVECAKTRRVTPGERSLRQLAADNHGLIDRGTALDLGVTEHVIRRELSSGRWSEIHPGVYYLNVTQMTWQARVRAAVFAAGPDAVASHRTAGILYGFDGIFGTMIELTVPCSELPVPAGVTVHRTRRRLPKTTIDSIPISTAERALLDLSSLVGERILEKVMASAIHKRVVTLDSMDEAVALYGGRGVRGTRKMRRVIRLVEQDRTGSPSEVDVVQMVRDAPIPHPVTQLEVRLPSGIYAYPDFAWPDRRRLVEIDGFESHSTPDQQQHDLDRQNQLMDLGWRIRRFTARQVRRNPALFMAELVDFVDAPFEPFREDPSRPARGRSSQNGLQTR